MSPVDRKPLINPTKKLAKGEPCTAPWTGRRKGVGLRPRAWRRALAPVGQARAPEG
jgi:hypothetical protein